MSPRLDDLLFPPTGGEIDDEDLAVHADGVGHSRSELRRRAAEIAAAIAEAGGGQGSPVGVMLPNGADLIATLFGVWRAGGVYVPLNPRLGSGDLDHVLATVEPSVIVTTTGHQSGSGGPDRQQADDLAYWFDVWERFGERGLVLLGDDTSVRPGTSGASRYDRETALIQLTSGTTGRPRPVLLEHAGVLTLIDGVLDKLRGGKPEPPNARSEQEAVRPPMPNLIPVSLSLWAGIYQVVFAFRAGNPVVVMDRFDAGEFAALVKRFGIRSTVLPPAAMAMLSDDNAVTDLEPLRFVRSITAPLSPLQARRFHERFGVAILNCYGQTEIGGEIVGWSAADFREFGESKLGAVGRPHAGVELRVIPTDSGQPIRTESAGSTDQNEVVGEIVVRTPAMSTGYADGADLGDRLTPDGWFRTGDVGRVDDDGFLWIDGRLSDMINRGGLKVFPAEVEEVLLLSSDVDDVAVVGVSDDRLGQVPVAFVVPAGGSNKLDRGKLAEHCRNHLAPYKIPVAFHPLGELPRNEVGKVLKTDLARSLT